MLLVAESYWDQVQATGLAVPTDRPLDELTAELTRMLGDTDPEVREELARPTLSTWVARGVYDDLLPGLGDGIATGLEVGLGEQGTDTVFRRSASVLVLAACIERDNQRPLVPGGKVLEWGDRIATYLLRERDLRGRVGSHGWAHAIARGGDALAVLAASPHLAVPELTVLLDVVADRVVAPVTEVLAHGEPDHLAGAVMAVLRRNQVPLSVAEPWVARVAATAQGAAVVPRGGDEVVVRRNAEAFLRALYLQLALGRRQPDIRSDLLLVVVDALKACNPLLSR